VTKGELSSHVGINNGYLLYNHYTSYAKPPKINRGKGRKGHLNTTQLNHVESQDCLSWYAD